MNETVIVSSDSNQDDLSQSPIELSPPETQISTSSLMTSSSDKLLNMISPEECSGVSNLSPSPSPPQSPSVHNNHTNTSHSSSSLGSNKRLAIHNHHNHQHHHHNNKFHHNNINNNILNFNNNGCNNLKQDNNGSSSISSSIGTTSITSNNLNHNNNNLNNNYNNNDIDFKTTSASDSNNIASDGHANGSDGMSKSKSNESQLSVNGISYKQWPHNNGSAMSSSEISSETATPIPAPRTKYPITSSSTMMSDYNDSCSINTTTTITHSMDSGSIGSHSIVTPITPIIISDTSAPPRSPCTPVRGMGHMIQHRFSKKFKFTSSTCDLCNKQMFFGFKCTECKYRCHKDCKSNVPPSCGLPKEFVDEFKKTLYSDGLMMPNSNASPNLPRAGLMPIIKRNEPRHRTPMHSIPFHGADSSSAGSSCNSSSPSSPALLTIPPQTPANKSQFNFPEVSSSNITQSSLMGSGCNQIHQIPGHHTSNYLSSYPNTIIEDAELEQSSGGSNGGHSKDNDINSAMYLRNSLISPHNNVENQIKLNGSIIDSSGKFENDIIILKIVINYCHNYYY